MDYYPPQPPLLPGQAYPGGPMIGEIYQALEQQQRQEQTQAPITSPGVSPTVNLLLLSP